jgi:hypothetical protein
MKQVIIPAAFTPSAGTISFSNVTGFVPARLLAIINSTARAVIYDPTTVGIGITSIAGSVLTLQANISAQGATDRVIAFYDDGQEGATAANQPSLNADGGALAHITNFPATQTITGVVTTNDGGAAITGATMPTGGSGLAGWLSAIWTKLSGTLAVSWTGSPNVTVANSSMAVTGTFYPSTQPVSAASLPLPTGAATAASQPSLNADGGALAHITNFPSTQTITGVVTTNDGGAAITGATMPTGGSGLAGWLSAIWTKLSGTLAVSWTGSPNVTVANSSMAVTGTFYPATQPVSAASLPLPTGAATAANQPALNADGGALAHITNFPASQAVSGAVSITNLPSTQAVSWSGQTVGVSSLPSLPAGANVIGSVNVANFPSSQSVSDLQSAPFSGAVAMTAGTTYAAQRSLGVLCTSSGNVQMQLSDGSSLALPVTGGWQTFPFAVVQIVAAGTTATATYFNLK